MIQNGYFPRVRFEHHVRRSVWLPAVVATVGMGLYFVLASALVQLSSPPATAAAASAQPSQGQSVAAVPACTPTLSQALAALDLSQDPAGLTVQADPVTQYRIYGNTAGQLRTQIEQCAPNTSGSSSAEYTADTSYAMSWQYTVVTSDTCRLGSVKVGVHIMTTMPLWQPTASAAAGLGNRWNIFVQNLAAHEAGHAALDKQYAARIADDLNALPAMDCSLVASSVKRVVNNDIVALNQANDTYDATTNHGATQGAVLPTH